MSTSTSPASSPDASRSRPRWFWVVIGVAVLLVLGVGGPYAYIHVGSSEAPAPLSLASGPTTSATAGASTTTAGAAGASPTTLGGATATTAAEPGTRAGGAIDGTWNVAAESQAGYRVKETLLGQSTEAVGRTTAVTGTATIASNMLTAAEITVDMTKVASDKSQRDGQFQGRIMETSQFPTATFKVTAPADLGTIPPDGTNTTIKVTGDLTLHGATKRVTIDLTGQRSGASLKVSGAVPIVFADYGINNPSGGPATVGDEGTLEFLVVLTA